MQSEEQGTEVTVPHLAESLVSATVIKWLKAPGDDVREYETLCELATDKVNVEMPSPVEGKLLRVLVPEGETADVGAPICVIRQAGAGREPGPPAESVSRADEGDGQRARYSPAVARLAMEHGVDLRQIKGSSLGGRINRKDVLAYVDKMREPATQYAGPFAKPAEKQIGTAKETITGPASPEPPRSSDDHHLPSTPIRKTIAQRMRQSAAEIPHAWMTIEADVSRLVDLRNQLKEAFERKEGVRLTVTPFVIKAIVNAIKDYPILNATWDTDHVVLKKPIHVSVAIGSEESVVTPVIRDADRKTIAGLAVELEEWVRRAKAGKLTLDDLHGGTITFNNTGSFGSLLSYPIIPYPQAAIITFETIVRRPVVFQQDMIAIRSVANLCLSLDHRILDGMICGRFLQRVKHYLEQYGPDSQIY